MLVLGLDRGKIANRCDFANLSWLEFFLGEGIASGENNPTTKTF